MTQPAVPCRAEFAPHVSPGTLSPRSRPRRTRSSPSPTPPAAISNPSCTSPATASAPSTARPIRPLPPARQDPAQEKQVLDRYSITYPFILYAGAIRAQKNIPRLVEAFAVLHEELGESSSISRSAPDHHRRRAFKHPGVRRAVTHSRIEQAVRFLGFVPLETLRVFYRAAGSIRLPLSLRRFRTSSPRSHGVRHGGGRIQSPFPGGSGGRGGRIGESPTMFSTSSAGCARFY